MKRRNMDGQYSYNNGTSEYTLTPRLCIFSVVHKLDTISGGDCDGRADGGWSSHFWSYNSG